MYYVQRDGIEHGPLTGEQLKRMAADGQLRREDKLRKDDDSVWHSAGKVKSLFPDTQLVPSSGATVPQSSSLQTVQVQPYRVEVVQPMQPQASMQMYDAPQAAHVPMAVAIALPVVATPPPITIAQEVPCPFCHEQIKREAKKCKHCGEILDIILRQSMAPQQHVPAPVIHINNVNNNDNTAVAVAAVGYGGRRYKAWSPLLAMLLSLILPGLGQLYKGQALNGIAWFIIVPIGYIFLIIPGIALHICCIVGAGLGNPYRIE